MKRGTKFALKAAQAIWFSVYLLILQ